MQLNKFNAVHCKQYDIELVRDKENEYFYWYGITDDMRNKLASLPSTGVYVARFSHQNLQTWINDLENILFAVGIVPHTTIKVRTLIMSHLSDVQEEICFSDPVMQQKANHRLNFVKYLVSTYKDMNTEVNPDQAHKDFKAKYPKL